MDIWGWLRNRRAFEVDERVTWQGAHGVIYAVIDAQCLVVFYDGTKLLIDAKALEHVA